MRSICFQPRVLILVAILTAALIAFVRHGGSRKPDIILITVDTVRADHLSGYGYPLPTTPYLDTLIAEGVRFDNAYSTSSWTVPAIASLLTSLNPYTHQLNYGVVKNHEVLLQPKLPDAYLTLPEVLKQSGYQTLGVVENGHLTAELGFAQGFDSYRSYLFTDGFEAIDEAIRSAAALDRAKPRFIWVHLFAPHAPYSERLPYAEEFFSGDGLPSAKVPILDNAQDYSRYQYARDGEELAALRALYNSELRATDEALGKLVRALDPERAALLVVTSDHGEEFLEHGSYGHTTLWPEVTRIPLIVRFPGARAGGRRDGRLVSLTDLAPTILRAAAIDAPAEWQGLPLFDGRKPAPLGGRTLLLHSSRSPEQTIDLLITETHKLYQFINGEELTHRLFVTADGEAEAAAASATQIEGTLLRRIALQREQYRTTPSSAVKRELLDARKLEQLRSLGYLR